MHRLRAVGIGITLGSILAYTVGIWVAYPGRALSITAFMIGVTVAAIGGSE